MPPSLADAIGGPLGAAESALPAAAFVAVYTAGGQEVETAAIVAVAIAVVLGLARILRGQTIQYALGGLFGVAFAGFVATRTGRAEDFFLPGLLANLGWGAAFLISAAVRRPIIGYLAVAIGARPRYPTVQEEPACEGESCKAQSDFRAWRTDPAFVRAATRTTLLWAGLFITRLAVQLPLYFTDSLVALGTAKIAMGIPLFALGVWISWLLMRPVVMRPHAPGDGATA